MKILFAAFAAAAVAFGSSARSATLKEGDDAPKIQVSKWAQGEEVKEFEGDKVYIVEFWATWCGPCLASIPHLNELHEKYKEKGLVIIGQNLGEDATKVSGFLANKSAAMKYRVTVDTAAGTMGKTWLTAAGQNGIPCAFVINKKGKIASIGHPMQLKDSLLEKLLAEPSTKASAGPEAAATGPSAKAVELINRAGSEINSGKLSEAEATIASLQETLPANLGYVGGLLEMQLLIAKKQPSDAIELSKLLCEDYAKEPVVLVQVAGVLISSSAPGSLEQAAAEKIAAPLGTAEGGSQGAALSVLARIAHLKGDKARAVELQTKAVSLAGKENQAEAKATLDLYRK